MAEKYHFVRLYKFSKNFTTKWLGIWTGERFNSFGHSKSDGWSFEEVKKKIVDSGSHPIKQWLKYDFGRLAQECLEGKYTDYLVWDFAYEKSSNPSGGLICTCPPQNFRFFGIGCTCGVAQLEKGRR